MSADRYVILDPEGTICWDLQTADEAQTRIRTYSKHGRVYTAHKIDSTPTVFETREEKLERLVDAASVVSRHGQQWDVIVEMARELRDSRPSPHHPCRRPRSHV